METTLEVSVWDIFTRAVSGFFGNVVALGDASFINGFIVVLLFGIMFLIYNNRVLVKETHRLLHDDVKNILQNLWSMESAIKTYIMESRSYTPKITVPASMQEHMANMASNSGRLEIEVKEMLKFIRARKAGAAVAAAPTGAASPAHGDSQEAQSRLEARLEALSEQIKAGLSGGVTSTNGVEIPKDLQNRLESRLEAISEQIKAGRRDGGDTGELRDIMERQGVYLHDEFAAISEKISRLGGAGATAGHSGQTGQEGHSGHSQKEVDAGLSDIVSSLRELREMIERGGMASGVSGNSGVSGGDQSAVLDMLTQSMNRLSGEVDAKLTLLNEKLERNLSARWTDALGSIDSLRSRLEEFANAGEQINNFNTNIASLSRMMMSRLGDSEEGGRQKLAELLSPLISSEHFSLDFDLPNGHCAAALIRFPDYNVCVDAGLSLQSFTDSLNEKMSAAERDAKRDAFRRELTSQVNHVADNLIMPPHTGESALMFVPSEGAFAEIHTRHRMVVQMALSRRVWIVSPTTFMAIINTANSAIRDRDAYARLHEMQQKVVEIVEEVRGFENRLAEIGDHVNSAWRSIQRAEGAGSRLAGNVRDISRVGETRDIQSLSHDKSA